MTTSAVKNLSMLIKKKAHELGFDLCGIAPSGILKEHESILKNWCSSGMNGEMNYLGQNIEKRINPALLLPGARSVIVTGLNYYTDRKQGGKEIPVISRYAISYHDVIKKKLNIILDYAKSINPEIKGKSFVDSAPVLEKAWAREAGLGWPGRHSILINKKIGSFFFIGVIILTTDMEYDEPFGDDNCENCRLCIDSCPTAAINEDRTIDVRRCIAYLTIESKNPVPEELAGKFEGRVFGCDKCQEVCPWNKKSEQNNTPEFVLSEEIRKLTPEEWINLSEEQFEKLFKRSSIERKRYDRFMKNVTIVKNSGI
jgi:epoxyqueuosine reductase